MENQKEENSNGIKDILLAIILVMGFIFSVAFFAYYIKENYGITENTTHKVPLSLLLILLSSLGVLIGCLVYYLLTRHYDMKKKSIALAVKETLNFLPHDEREVLCFIIDSKGETVQSRIVENTKLGKVKVSRVISRLENKGIIEKQNNGMSNKVILRTEFKKIFI